MILLEGIDKHDLANHEVERLLITPNVFSNTYYQIASVYARQGNTAKGVELLRKAAEKGFMNFEELRNDKEWFGSMQALPNFEELVKEFEERVSKTNV
jgi:hypothetical protein